MGRYEIRIQKAEKGRFGEKIEVITCIVEADTLLGAVEKAFEEHPEADIDRSFRGKLLE